MIDDYAQAMALLNKIKDNLPIPAQATGVLVRSLRQHEIVGQTGQELEIKSVFYGGDEGGILCDVTPPEMHTTPILCSLTQLRVRASHPLAAEIRAYQRVRVRKLAINDRAPTSFTLEPRQQRRR